MHSANIFQWHFLWLVAASLIAGVMNALAGGGSFLSFPAFLGVGVPPVQANATNTVALWPGQLTSLYALRGDVPRELAMTVVLMSLVGGIAGAETLLHTSQRTFLHLIPWLILFGSVMFAVSGWLSRWVRRRVETSREHRAISRLWLGLALLPVCFYIGYFGAGGGFLTMTILALFGMEDMHALNALKVVSQAASNFFAILTFVVTNNIVWRYCFVAMVFAALGGWLGAKLTKRMSGAVLRAVIVAIGFSISAWFFWRHG